MRHFKSLPPLVPGQQEYHATIMVLGVKVPGRRVNPNFSTGAIAIEFIRLVRANGARQCAPFHHARSRR